MVRDYNTAGNSVTDVDLRDFLDRQSSGLAREYCGIMEPEKSPLDEIMEEIDRALDAGFFYLAVATTLTLPDICVSLSETDGRSNGARYAAWCDANLTDGFGFVTGQDLFSFRCGVSHNGRFGDLKHNVARVVFSLPFGGNRFINMQINDAFVYSVEDFCRNIMRAVRAWYAANSGVARVVQNLERMGQYRPEGLAPYIGGMPVLA